MRESGGMREGQTKDTVVGNLYRLSELQGAPWWGVEDGGLVCVEKGGRSKGGRGGGTK